jgi:hypothetical protein
MASFERHPMCQLIRVEFCPQYRFSVCEHIPTFLPQSFGRSRNISQQHLRASPPRRGLRRSSNTSQHLRTSSPLLQTIKHHLKQSSGTSQHRQAYLSLLQTIAQPFKRPTILFSISASFIKLLQAHKNRYIVHPTHE